MGRLNEKDKDNRIDYILDLMITYEDKEDMIISFNDKFNLGIDSFYKYFKLTKNKLKEQVDNDELTEEEILKYIKYLI